METAALKKKLRKKYQDKRMSSNRDALDSISKSIRKNLLSYFETIEIDSLFSFVPTNNEIDLMPMIKSLSIPVGLPVIGADAGQMIFHQWEKNQAMVENRFGILEPSKNNKVLYPSEKSVVLVPALAINDSGYRLGYGGGYYDRLLADLKSSTICCIAEEFCCKNLPTNEFDLSVNGMMTEVGITWFHR
jgi:5-formyltetrahydrofolate cyclo-ligase